MDWFVGPVERVSERGGEGLRVGEYGGVGVQLVGVFVGFLLGWWLFFG